ncbi:MAG: DUF4123 domain-containing protein [Desulfobulbaceae bacterium]|nr:DUF4123 domain-containing protein [Desulfobulbaceae bacterium]MCK5437455.1 DUF4123 domain-containing protein [Desulfobulbaceae bacterium]
MPEPQQLEKIKQILFLPPEDRLPVNTYAVLDTARDKVIYPKIINADVQSICLYHGAKAVEMATVAPYLVHLKKNDSFTEWLLTQGWGNSWGIFLQAPVPFKLNELQRHFRKFLMVYDEDGKPLYFRFYDPRVFRVYLPTCNKDELEIIYGPILRYHVEGGDASQFVEFACTEEYKLIENVVDL